MTLFQYFIESIVSVDQQAGRTVENFAGGDER